MRARLLLTALAVLGVGAPAAEATWKGSRGLIAYSDGRLHTIRPDGTGHRVLAPGGGLGLAWSRHGSRLAFTHPDGLATVRPSGRDLRVILPRSPPDPSPWDPAWSPDGQRLVVTLLSERRDGSTTGDIHTLRTDGTELRRIATGRWATWSPDGQTIAFSEEDGDIAAVAPSGDGYRVLASHDGQPIDLDFSPDGRRLAYEQGAMVRTLDLRTAARTGFATDYGTAINAVDLVWTPRGRRIAFTHWGVRRGGRAVDEIRTVRPDGTRVRILVRLPPSSTGQGAADLAWQSR